MSVPRVPCLTYVVQPNLHGTNFQIRLGTFWVLLRLPIDLFPVCRKNTSKQDIIIHPRLFSSAVEWVSDGNPELSHIMGPRNESLGRFSRTTCVQIGCTVSMAPHCTTLRDGVGSVHRHRVPKPNFFSIPGEKFAARTKITSTKSLAPKFPPILDTASIRHSQTWQKMGIPVTPVAVRVICFDRKYRDIRTPSEVSLTHSS